MPPSNVRRFVATLIRINHRKQSQLEQLRTMRYIASFLLLTLISLFTYSCLGFSSRAPVIKRRRPAVSASLGAARRCPREYNQDGVTIVNLDNDNDVSSLNNQEDGLVAACDFSETFGPNQERRTIDGDRIFYRWIPSQENERPAPHLYEINTNNNENNDLVIDKNGNAWRTQEALREQGLTRHKMEATQQLWRQLNTTTTSGSSENVVLTPIPWSGPLNLPPRERGTGSNRKLRDDLQFGCELDDERWLVHYTKLATFRSRFGHVNVPLHWQEDATLGRWVSKQRVLYRRLARNKYYQHEILADGRLGRKVNPLSPWRIQMLYDLGFSFKINLRWHDRLAQLERFRNKHGHVEVPATDSDEEFPGLNLWVQSQRTEYRRWKEGMPSSMTKRRFVLLDRLGLDWDPLASMWDSRIEQLKKHREKYGNIRVSRTQDFELASWLIYVRKQYRLYQESPWDSALTEDRITELQELDMDWKPLKNRWQQQFHALVDFRKENGHTAVPVDYTKDPSLALWVQKQRYNFRMGTLSEENEAQLRSIDFVFNTYDEAFRRGLEKLRVYREEHGDCRVPASHSDRKLVSFVKLQRSQYRKLMNGESSSLTEERIQQLEELGFEWRIERRQDPWDNNCEKLRVYRDEHDNCNVPSDFEDQSLYQFVSRQRTQYRRLQNGELVPLSTSRIKKLEELGFVWNANDARWMERYNELAEFKRANGHCNVPDRYMPNPKLATWVRNQRVQYRGSEKGKKSSLTPSRIELLQEIGFQWSVRKPIH